EVGSAMQFQQIGTPMISCAAAWPCLHMPYATPNWTRFTASSSSNNNQSLIVLWDSGTEGGLMRDVNLSSGEGPVDYCGMGLAVRPGIYGFTIEKISFISGPSNSPKYIDTTWCPEIYFTRDSTAVSGVYGVISWNL